MIYRATSPSHIDGRQGGIYVDRPCELHMFRCDVCDLQSRCSELFDNGARCPIVNQERVWLNVTQDFEAAISTN